MTTISRRDYFAIEFAKQLITAMKLQSLVALEDGCANDIARRSVKAADALELALDAGQKKDEEDLWNAQKHDLLSRIQFISENLQKEQQAHAETAAKLSVALEKITNALFALKPVSENETCNPMLRGILAFDILNGK